MSNKCGDYITNIAAEYTFFRGAQQRLKQSKDISRFKILPSSYPSPPPPKKTSKFIIWNILNSFVNIVYGLNASPQLAHTLTYAGPRKLPTLHDHSEACDVT